MPITPAIIIMETADHGAVCILVDWGGGDGPRLSRSVPTGNQGGYPEAIAAARERCERTVREHVADMRTRFPTLTVTDPRNPQPAEQGPRTRPA